MTKNNSLQKTTILMVLLLLLVIGCVLLFLLFIYPQVFVLGVSVDEKYGTDYQGLGSARIIPRSSGEEIRIEGDSIVLPDGFYDSNYEVVELYDETELQSGGRRGSTKGDECVRDRDCGSTKTKEYCYFGSVYEETTTYSCTNGYCESDKDKEKIEICQYGCSNALCLQNCVDADGDGYDSCGPQAPNDDGKPVDCNDNNNKIHPNAVEICDGKDNDCDGQIDEGSSICGVNQVCSQGMCAAILCTGNSDCGSDGFIGSRYCQGNTVHQDFKTFMCANAGSASSSCSSTTNSVPIKQCAGNEMCSNGACVGVTCSTTQDCGTSDFEGNTFCQNGDVYKNFRSFMCSNAGKPTSSCSSSTSPQLFDDCNSGEVCSNGACINKCSDNDTDGFDVCQTGTPGDDGKPVDCNDNNAGINPGASDVQCNGVDNDCDGQIDEGYVTATTNCGVGECGKRGTKSCVNGNEVNSCTAGSPVAEICDGKDNDCDGQSDEGFGNETKVFGREPWVLFGEVETELHRQGKQTPKDLLGGRGGSAYIHDDFTLKKICNIFGYSTYVASDNTSSDGRTIWTNGGDSTYKWKDNIRWERIDDLTGYRNPFGLSWVASVTCKERLLCPAA